MNIQRVKQGARITLYNGIYMILFGLFFVYFAEFIMKMNFNAITQLWGFFETYNSKIALMFWLFNILIGIFLISSGIFHIYLSDFIIKRKEKMTWVILFLSGIISWAGLLTISIIFRNWLLIGLSAFGWLTFLLGMLIPIQYYLEKSYREY